MVRKKFRSKVRESIHELAVSMHKVGAISDVDMQRYDRSCLLPLDVPPEKILALRTREEVSQADFAHHLNVSPGLISQWERGEKKPSGPSLKLLDLVQRKGLEAIL